MVNTKSQTFFNIFYFILSLRMCCAFVYYGLTLASPSLGGSIYVNFSVSSFMEILSVFYCQFTLNRFGRLSPLRLSFIMGGIGLLSTLLVPNGEGKLYVIFLELHLRKKYNVIIFIICVNVCEYDKQCCSHAIPKHIL